MDTSNDSARAFARGANARPTVRRLASAAASVAMAHALLAPSSAAAQAADTESASQPGPAQQEIIVTAERRAESISKTPISITGITGRDVVNKQVTSIADLARVVPNVVTGMSIGVNRIYVRGIGLNSFAAGSDASVAFYVDGVYVARPAAQLTSYFDVDRIEVLRGPQGELYGRNATGGAVNLISRSPTSGLTGDFRVTGGNYDLVQVEGAISGPIVGDDKLNGRIAFQTIDRSGYAYNRFLKQDIENQHSQAIRLSLESKPTEAIDIKLIGEYFHQDDRAYVNAHFDAYPGNTLLGVALGYPYLSYSRDTFSQSNNANRRRNYSLTGKIGIDLGSGFALDSTTGWRKFRRFNNEDLALTAANLGDGNYLEVSKQFSHEMTLSYDNGPLSAIVGGSYFHENFSNDVVVYFPQFGSGNVIGYFGPNLLVIGDYNPRDYSVTYEQHGKLNVDAYAAYGRLTYEATPGLKLTVGGRYSIERRATTGVFQGPLANPVPIDLAKTWRAFTPNARITWEPTQNVFVYASASKGFKSGTFNVGQDNSRVVTRADGSTFFDNGAINPEKITAFEAGVKTNLFDRKLSISAAIYKYRYTDLQVNKIFDIQTLTVNAASADIKGWEATVRGNPFGNLILNASVSYTDATFDDFNSVNPYNGVGADLTGGRNGLSSDPANPGWILKGYQLPGTAKWTVDLGAEYAFALGNGGTLTANADMHYKSRIYYSEFNDVNVSQEPVTTYDASLRYDAPGGKWSLTAWGKNLSNELVATTKILTIELWGYPIYGAWAPPRTYGATLGFNF